MPFVELLAPYHDRAAFDCGEDPLNRFLQQQARQNADRYLGATHVAVPEPLSAHIEGYFTLVTRTVEASSFMPGKRLSPGPIGVVLLGQLAVARDSQGRGLGSQMLLRAMAETAQAAARVGIHALVLDTLNERARDWYLKLDFGFHLVPDQPRRLFVPMSFIRQLDLGPLTPRL